MDEQQQRVFEDLKGSLRGELRFDPPARAIYATDASLYEIMPLGVVFPRDRDDVVVLAQYAAERSIPLVPRGAGSGLAGSALGSGLIVDFSRFMRRVESIDGETVRVQPGIVRDQLNRVLRQQGRYFPPDPSSTSVTTVGGMLAVDAAGSHSVRVGSMRDHVSSVELVTMGGRRIECGNESLDVLQLAPPTALESAADDDVTEALHYKRTLISKLAKLLGDNAALIQQKQPAGIRNASGYFLRGVLTASHLNLARMLVGSEGTLGMFTAATLQTAPLPPFRGVAILLFGELESAVKSVAVIAGHQPSACDLIDRRVISLGREANPRFAAMISSAAEAALIVEQTGVSDREVRSRLDNMIRAVRNSEPGVVVAAEGYDPDEVDLLWSLPSTVVPLLTRLRGETRPLPFVEDIAVPPEAMHDFLTRAQKVFQRHQVTASLYAHAASGQLHLRPFLPIPAREDGQQLEAIARDLYQAVFAVGGSISGEHGDGLARTAFIRSQYGPLYRVFQEIKTLFDPHNLMNPGKIVSDDGHITVRHFRSRVAPPSQTVELQLRWTPDELGTAVARCNGCGSCRTRSPDLRMCPFFKIGPREETSPRAKANVMRGLLAGAFDEREAASDEMKQIADLCFNCKQCELECPSNVNVPHMMIEAKAGYVAANGLKNADWILSRAHSLAAFGSTAATVANWAISNPASRWFLEKSLGIARQRKLPFYARRTFLRSARRLTKLPPAGDGPKPIVYFVADYANYHDPELAKAFVAILQHNGLRVHVPPDQVGSGMAMISAGDLASARKVAEINIRALGELAREQYTIVCTEPSAALALKQEYAMVLDHPDVAVVASRVVEAGDFLLRLHREGKLRTDFSPLDFEAGYHTPCHLKALGAGRPLLELLSLIPELRVEPIEQGCSGMAGAFGLTAENFRTSMRIGWGLISRMRDGDLKIGVTECSSCKMQMEQGTTTPTLHPLKLIALAYGLMPEIRQRLNPNTRKLVVS